MEMLDWSLLCEQWELCAFYTNLDFRLNKLIMKPRAHSRLSLSERIYLHLIAHNNPNWVSSSTAYSQEAAKTSMKLAGRDF